MSVESALARALPVGDHDAAHAALDAGLAVARPGALVAVAIPAPPTPYDGVAGPHSHAVLPPPVAAMLAAAPARRDAAVWEPRDGGWSMACAGVAVELRAEGSRRFAAIAEAAATTWSRLSRVGADDAPAPRFFGGFAFAPGAARGPAWDGFADARFVLPRWTYARRGDAAWLIAIVDGDPHGRDGWHGELAELRAALVARPAASEPAVLAVHEDDAATWRRHVGEIRAAIAAGGCAKIVAARGCAIELAGPVDPAAVLRRLGERHPECTRFAIRAAGRVFLGATPERLVALTGREVTSEALAGSIARTGDDAGEIAQLLASDKDRWEHDLVVRAIADGLGARCARLDVPAVPLIRSLRHIHHLHTPVRGTLAARSHVVEIAGALHPTPAVGGVPTATAMAWIAEREPAPRGWYGSPVGWFDSDGDGELVVAIRSGLLDGRHATLFAGAGIVADSDPDLELDETRVKLRALQGALGVVP